MQVIFDGEAYGLTAINEKGELIIPLELRKALKIKPGDRLVVLAKPDEKFINLVPVKDFSSFVKSASRLVSKIKKKDF